MLLRIGVKENISIKFEQSIERLSLERKYPLVKPYLHFIDCIGSFYDSITRPYISLGQHGIKNFVFVEYLEHTRNYTFSVSFWKMILENHWNKIYSYCNESTYYTRLGNKPVISFFEYYVKNNLSIPANDGKCYKSTELYSSCLKKLVDGFFPVVHDDICFNKEQEKFLGIKAIITIEDCFNLLRNLEGSYINNDRLKQIDSIYRQLIKNNPDDILKNRNLNIGSLKLLATDNTFQSVSSLYCFGVKGVLPPSATNYFIKISESLKDKEVLCSIFNIPVVTNNDLQFKPKNEVRDQELINLLNDKAKYFATILANINAEDPKIILQNITKKISLAKFYTAQSLSLVFFNKHGEEIYNQSIESWFHVDTNSIFYVGLWSNPLTLYSLSNSLCSFFEIGDKDREVALLLQLTDMEAEKWLSSKGYEIVKVNPDEVTDAHEINPQSYWKKDNDSNTEPFNGEIDSKIQSQLKNNDVDNDGLSEESNNQIQHEPIAYSSNHEDKNTEFNKIYDAVHDVNNDFLDSSENYLTPANSSNNQMQNNKINRLISYVSNESNDDFRQNIDSKRFHLQSKSKAKKIVCDYEEKAGHTTTEISEIQEAYDIITRNKETGEIERYIQVFGFFGEWNNYDVALLSTLQLKIAKEKADQFWIYVVEFVEDDQNMRLYRIQNPFDKITKYAFDHGWRAIAEQIIP